jgi:predicted Rossmann fold flavoprotein
MTVEHVDLLIVGAGAAGLAAGIHAGERARALGRRLRIVAVDGARRPGAKILVSGGGRCNVTNREVTPEDYNGGSRATIRRILRSFDNRATLEWMAALGVELKLEPTGKYFPTTDSARTVLEALLGALAAAGVELRTSWRATGLTRGADGFLVTGPDGAALHARRLIMATGGLSLPKSGSDGAGLEWLRALGLRINPTTPALAPLVLDPDGSLGGRLRELSGMTIDLRLELREPSGRKLYQRTGSTLFTHFGMSGPAPMDFSRHFAQYRLAHPGVRPVVLMAHPDLPDREAADRWLLHEAGANPKRLVATAIEHFFPGRLAALLAEGTGRLGDLTRDQRRDVAARLAALPLPVSGDRGYTFAETTAGGVDLAEVDPRTMEARAVPGLHLCGELLDVDGRIGGFNFQWAWATGWLAGRAAVEAS